MSDTTTTPILDVEKLEKCHKLNCVESCFCCQSVRQLLRTIPADKSSAAYCYWLLAQGHKVCASTWKPGEYLQVDEYGTVRDQNGRQCNVGAYCGNTNKAWLIYTPPPAVDDELRRKCVRAVVALAGYKPGGIEFSHAELQRLKELQ